MGLAYERGCVECRPLDPKHFCERLSHQLTNARARARALLSSHLPGDGAPLEADVVNRDVVPRRAAHVREHRVGLPVRQERWPLITSRAR